MLCFAVLTQYSYFIVMSIYGYHCVSILCLYSDGVILKTANRDHSSYYVLVEFTMSTSVM